MPEHSRKDDMLLEKHILDETERAADIERRLAAIEVSMANFNDAWTQAKGVLTFIKILAGIGAAAAAIYTFFSSNFTIIPK